MRQGRPASGPARGTENLTARCPLHTSGGDMFNSCLCIVVYLLSLCTNLEHRTQTNIGTRRNVSHTHTGRTLGRWPTLACRVHLAKMANTKHIPVHWPPARDPSSTAFAYDPHREINTGALTCRPVRASALQMHGIAVSLSVQRSREIW